MTNQNKSKRRLKKVSRQVSRQRRKKSSNKKRTSKKIATMHKESINPREYPVELNIRDIRNNFFQMIQDLAMIEKTEEKQTLISLENIGISILRDEILDCAEHETDQCINFIRQLQQMRKLGDMSIEEKLNQRLESRMERLFRLIHLKEQEHFYTNSEVKEKIEKIIKNTGGLEINLSFDKDTLFNIYEDILGSRIMKLYQKFQHSINVKNIKKVKNLIEEHTYKLDELRKEWKSKKINLAQFLTQQNNIESQYIVDIVNQEV